MQAFKHKKSHKSQGLVEFALVLPVLLMLLFGIIEVGRLMFIYVAVTTSSREASRFGSATGDNGGGSPQYIDCTGIQGAAMALGSLAGVTAGDVTIQYDTGPGTSVIGTCGAYSGPPDLGDRILVTVTAQYTPMAIVPLFDFPTFPITSVSRRMILTSVPLEGQTPGSLWTSTVTVTPGGPTFTNTSTIPPTLTLVITDTATVIGAPTSTATFTRTATLVPSATSNIATATFTTPNAPLNPQGGATKNGNKCDDIWFSWSYNPAWAIDPGSYPIQYQVYKYANYQGLVASNDPADTTWTTSLSLNNNGTITLGTVAIWAGPQGSLRLWVSFLCDKGDLLITGSGVSP